jgi:quercetin dioxygenase-like cupin family protein
MKPKTLLLVGGMLLMLAFAAGSNAKRELVTDLSKSSIYINDTGNIKEQMLIHKDVTGDPTFYMGRVEFQPGAAVAEHVHPLELEAVYVLSGTGRMTIREQSFDIKPGSAVYVPPNTPHSFTNTGKEVVEVIHTYAPGGPEERFKSWSPQSHERH